MKFISITVVWATRSIQDVVPLTLADGATAAEAFAASRLAETYPLDGAVLGFALRGRRVLPGTRLHQGDRLDVTRPLLADPKDARRRRARAGGPGP